MGWEDLLAPEGGNERVLPWTGGRQVYGEGRTWNIQGRVPPEHGWYTFVTTAGRKARLVGEADPNLDYEKGRVVLRGYLVGDRLIPDNARVTPDPNLLIDQTLPVYLAEPGLDRFARVIVAEREDGQLIYVRQEFPAGPELEVEMAYQDRKDSLDGIKDVTPPLDLAFRWLSHQRWLAEERRRELERQRIEEEARLQAAARMNQLRESMGSPNARREVAVEDFELAARAALAVTNSELLDSRPGYERHEMIVQYKVRERRLECVVDRRTLRIVDAGICLQDSLTGEKGDTRFTLESLPSVVEEALDTHRLVVWRHVPGDVEYRYDDDDDDDDDIEDEDW